MVDKSQLLKDLREFLSVEEEIVRNLSTFFQSLGWKNTIGPEHHQRINEILKTLQADTQIHALTIQEMLRYIEHKEQNEF